MQLFLGAFHHNDKGSRREVNRSLDHRGLDRRTGVCVLARRNVLGACENHRRVADGSRRGHQRRADACPTATPRLNQLVSPGAGSVWYFGKAIYGNCCPQKLTRGHHVIMPRKATKFSSPGVGMPSRVMFWSAALQTEPELGPKSKPHGRGTVSTSCDTLVSTENTESELGAANATKCGRNRVREWLTHPSYRYAAKTARI